MAEISGIGISKISKDMVFDTGGVAAAAAPKRSLIVIQDHFQISCRQRCYYFLRGFIFQTMNGPIRATGIGRARWFSIPIHNNAVKTAGNNVIQLIGHSCG